MAWVFVSCIRSAKKTRQSAALADSLEQILLKSVHLNDEALHRKLSDADSMSVESEAMDADEADILAVADGLANGTDRFNGMAGNRMLQHSKIKVGKAGRTENLRRLLSNVQAGDATRQPYSDFSAIIVPLSWAARQHASGADALDTAWQAWQALENDVYKLLAEIGIEMPLL